MGAEQLVPAMLLPSRPVLFLLAVSYYLTGKIEEMLSCGYYFFFGLSIFILSGPFFSRLRDTREMDELGEKTVEQKKKVYG